MKKIDTTSIPFWPDKVVLGSADIRSDYSKHILSAADRDEVENFSNPNRKAEFVSARHLFQHLLTELNMLPEEVSLEKEKTGKPFATYKGNRINVSFSHSPGKVYCAISSTLNIGLDVEYHDREINERVIQRILNEKERETLGREKPVRLWTIKEAAVKCLGTGLRTNLNEMVIRKKEKNHFSVIFNNDKMFEICSFRLTDHQIALAYQSKNI